MTHAMAGQKVERTCRVASSFTSRLNWLAHVDDKPTSELLLSINPISKLLVEPQILGVELVGVELDDREPRRRGYLLGMSQ